ncbi:class C beta-lactamase [Erwinia billingiae]|uniref:class C beta-lactamase n=1 Tax=Erwinia billingiae TaxID=182337 RepID=UPI003D171FD3
MFKGLSPVVCLSAVLTLTSADAFSAPPLSSEQIKSVVDGQIAPLLKAQQIPGMAVAVIYQGHPWFFNYGVAEVKSGRPVSASTIFELGSVSKTFTGVLGGYAVQSGLIKLDDPVAKYSAELSGKQWRDITLLNLATYTAGGLPLQVPDAVTDQKSLWNYYQQWQPQWKAGTMRNYSNASIGLFGLLAVAKSNSSFASLMQQQVFNPLSLTHTYLRVPESAQADYAWGYKNGQPLRVTPGPLDEQAYGVKSSAQDMAKFLQANIDPDSLPSEDAVLKKSLLTAQKGYYQVGNLRQGLGWEMYDWPTNPQTIIADSANDVALKPREVRALVPARAATPASWIHKTGSTNGFGTYIAFIPAEKLGIVMLANKNYPNPTRVEAAANILQALR